MLGLLERSQAIYAVQVGFSIFQPAKFEQTIAHQHVFLRRESLIYGISVTIILCLHVIIAHHMCLNFLDMMIIFKEYRKKR
jgi:hypothetical protein